MRGTMEPGKSAASAMAARPLQQVSSWSRQAVSCVTGIHTVHVRSEYLAGSEGTIKAKGRVLLPRPQSPPAGWGTALAMVRATTRGMRTRDCAEKRRGLEGGKFLCSILRECFVDASWCEDKLARRACMQVMLCCDGSPIPSASPHHPSHLRNEFQSLCFDLARYALVFPSLNLAGGVCGSVVHCSRTLLEYCAQNLE